MLPGQRHQHLEALNCLLPVIALHQTLRLGPALLCAVWKLSHFEVILRLCDGRHANGAQRLLPVIEGDHLCADTEVTGTTRYTQGGALDSIKVRKLTIGC